MVSEIRCLLGSQSWFTGGCLLTTSSRGRRGNSAFWSLFYKDSNHIMGLCLQDLISPQRSHLLTPPHWRLGSNVWILEGYKHSVHSSASSILYTLPTSSTYSCSLPHPDPIPYLCSIPLFRFHHLPMPRTLFILPALPTSFFKNIMAKYTYQKTYYLNHLYMYSSVMHIPYPAHGLYL